MSETWTQPKLFDFGPDPADRRRARLPLVAAIAGDYLGRGLGLDDLLRAGASGLELALSLADQLPGGLSADYAAYWIRRGIVGALAADAAVTGFVADFSRRFDRRPNLAEVRGFNLAEAGLQRPETEVYGRLIDGFVDSYYGAFGQLPTVTEAAAFGQSQRQQLSRRLGSYLTDSFLGETSPEAGESEPGSLYIPASWLAGLADEPRQALVLRYGLDGSGIREVRDVGYRLNAKTRKIGEIVGRALSFVAENNGIASRQLLVYPHLFDGMADLDRRVLSLRLGAGNRPALEVREVAAKLGVSGEVVRHAEWRAVWHARENAGHNLAPVAVGTAA